MQQTDIHCHILPGVDDGAVSETETRAMLAAAQSAGIEAIVATPHLRKLDPTRQEAILAAYRALRPIFFQAGVPLYLGYECNQRLFLDHPAEEIGRFGLGDSDYLLVEFSSRGLPLQWEEQVQSLQMAGKEVIVAHPERYRNIQEDLSVARRMVQIGCTLQISATFMLERSFSRQRRTAKKLLESGLVTYIASDAHSSEDYHSYIEAVKMYGNKLRPSPLHGLEKAPEIEKGPMVASGSGL